MANYTDNEFIQKCRFAQDIQIVQIETTTDHPLRVKLPPSAKASEWHGAGHADRQIYRIEEWQSIC